MSQPTTRPPVALTIAGSDSGGGAGIQADLRTFHAFGVFGTTAITAITAQNTTGVEAVELVSPEMVRAQVDAVCRDLRPSAAKSGMLGNAAVVRACAAGVVAHGLDRYVLDPVMVATSGDRLLEPEAVAEVRDRLVPLAAVVTPNLPEAALLAGRPVESLDDMRAAARELVRRGAGAALVKGGHGAGEEVVDLLLDGHEERIWRAERIDTPHTHGTGCTLSAAIAAGLAAGAPLVEAVDRALRFTRAAIAAAPGLGEGRGPLDHWVASSDPGSGVG